MSVVLNFVLDGAAGLVEPAWLRAQRALTGAPATEIRTRASDWTSGVPDGQDPA
jgi:hypothetical protein